MTIRSDRFQRIVSVSFAAWFVFLTAFVQLHTHLKSPCAGEPGAGVRLDASTVSIAVETDPPEVHLPGLCPICLFLANYTAERPGPPPVSAPREPGPGATIGTEVSVLLSVDRTTDTPRAPPC